MLYRVCLGGLILSGIISCSGHWIKKEEVPLPVPEEWSSPPESNPIDPVEHEHDFDFRDTFEVLESSPVDISKIARYLEEDITLESSKTNLHGSQSLTVDDTKLESTPKHVFDNRPLVPIWEKVEDVKPIEFQLPDTRRPPLVAKDVDEHEPVFDYERDNHFQVDWS